jgi:hypothetical protein
MHSLVLSRLSFCAPLFVGISDKLIHKIQMVFNSALRVAYGLKRLDSVDQHMRDVGWLSARQHIHFRALSLIVSVMTHSSPSYLHGWVRPYLSQRSLRSQTSNLLVADRTRTTVADSAFRNFAPRLWNSLPSSIRESLAVPSIYSFLQRIRDHIISDIDH